MRKEIDILGLTYMIEEQAEYHSYGQVNHDKQVITIDKGISDERKRLTLLHEILHAVLHQVGEPDMANNEDFVHRLSTGLYTTLNPYLKL